VARAPGVRRAARLRLLARADVVLLTAGNDLWQPHVALVRPVRGVFVLARRGEDVVGDLLGACVVVRQRCRCGRGDPLLEALHLGALGVALTDAQVTLLVQGRDRGVLLGVAARRGGHVDQCCLERREVLLGHRQVAPPLPQRAVGVELGLQGGLPTLQDRPAFRQRSERRVGTARASALGQPRPPLFRVGKRVELTVHRDERDRGPLRPGLRRRTALFPRGDRRGRDGHGRRWRAIDLDLDRRERVPTGQDAGGAEDRQGVPAARPHAIATHPPCLPASDPLCRRGASTRTGGASHGRCAAALSPADGAACPAARRAWRAAARCAAVQ
jgi:hypothetical protein